MEKVKNVYIDVDDSYNQEHGERPQLNFITIAVHATVDGDEVLQQYDVSRGGAAKFNDDVSEGEEIAEITDEVQGELDEYLEKNYDSDGNPLEGLWANYEVAWKYVLENCRKSVVIVARSMMSNDGDDSSVINWVINNGWQRRIVDAIRGMN